jgi:glutamine amidotransferase
MHNGQVGGYDGFRREADMMIPDALYPHRRGATDSEAIFLVALAEGLDDDPAGAMARSVARFEALARARGALPLMRMTAAFSDGRRLFAVRYASDDQAPTLYHRFSAGRRGRAVVSEPLDRAEPGWEPVPAGTICLFEGERVEIRPFVPVPLSAAA